MRGTEVHPIDYANACPDVALTSLHYYFPWAMSALARWTVFCCATGRTPRLDLDTSQLLRHRRPRPICPTRTSWPSTGKLADDYFETERYADFCASRMSHVDEVVYDWVCSDEFDQLLLDTVRATYPAAEHDRFIAHFRGLIDSWIADQPWTRQSGTAG